MALLGVALGGRLHASGQRWQGAAKTGHTVAAQQRQCSSSTAAVQQRHTCRRHTHPPEPSPSTTFSSSTPSCMEEGGSARALRPTMPSVCGAGTGAGGQEQQRQQAQRRVGGLRRGGSRHSAGSPAGAAATGWRQEQCSGCTTAYKQVSTTNRRQTAAAAQAGGTQALQELSHVLTRPMSASGSAKSRLVSKKSSRLDTSCSEGMGGAQVTQVSNNSGRNGGGGGKHRVGSRGKPQLRKCSGLAPAAWEAARGAGMPPQYR